MSDQHLGKPWLITGSLWMHGSRVKHLKKIVTIGCEKELEAAEAVIRDALYEKAAKAYSPADMMYVKIEVESEVEKSGRPYGRTEEM